MKPGTGDAYNSRGTVDIYSPCKYCGQEHHCWWEQENGSLYLVCCVCGEKNKYIDLGLGV